MQDLAVALNKKEIQDEFISIINKDIKTLNSYDRADKQFIKLTSKTTSKILKFVDTELKLVSKNHYRNIGLVLGMVVEIAIGINLGNKAAKEGKQLDVENVCY